MRHAIHLRIVCQVCCFHFLEIGIADTNNSRLPTQALIACPFCKDSPLFNFFTLRDGSARMLLAMWPVPGNGGPWASLVYEYSRDPAKITTCVVIREKILILHGSNFRSHVNWAEKCNAVGKHAMIVG